MITRAQVGKKGPAGGGGRKDRGVMLDESKKLLAMQKELLDKVR